MKQLLFLLLFPCLAMAQYPGNAGQKITLGEQTTADGLVWRGVLNDTALITPSSDTSAYIILDTVNNRFYNYNRSTNVWSLAGGGISVTSFSAGTTGLTPSSATTGAVTLGGTLAITNGGTGNSTGLAASSTQLANTRTIWGQNFNGTANVTGALSAVTTINASNAINTTRNLGYQNYVDGGLAGFEGKNWSNTNFHATYFASIRSRGTQASPLAVAANDVLFALYCQANAGSRLPDAAGIYFAADAAPVGDTLVPGRIDFRTVSTGVMTERMRISSNGNLGIGTTGPSERLHISGNARISGLAATGTRTVLADVNGVLSAPVSSINFKENVQPLSYGLNEILQINPISFDYIDKNKWGEDRNLGFIVEDIFPIIPEVTGTLENDAMYLDMTKLIPILTKAIQEQNLLIKALEQRILTLENK